MDLLINLDNFNQVLQKSTQFHLPPAVEEQMDSHSSWWVNLVDSCSRLLMSVWFLYGELHFVYVGSKLSADNKNMQGVCIQGVRSKAEAPMHLG